MDDVAATYDEPEATEFQPAVVESAVEFLAGLAGDGAALELGVGTGRIAVPLAPIMNLTTQAAQVACFRNAAAHLEPGGCCVIEVGIPRCGSSYPARPSCHARSAIGAGPTTCTTLPPRR